MFTRFRSKLLGAATLATGAGLLGYYFHQNFIIVEDDYRALVKTLQAKSTVITLSNNTISKRFGPIITSTILNDEFVENLTPEVKNFSFSMNVRQGNKEDPYDDFGEVMVSVIKIDELWHIDSIQIRFIESSYAKWLKLYECLHLKNKNTSSASVKSDDLISSPSLRDSELYLKNFKNSQPFILKSVELLLADREKLNNLGAPVRLVSHDLIESDIGYLLKMSIQGRKKNADLLVDIEQSLNHDWIILAMALMHEIKEDFMLSSKELAEKYYDDLIKNIPSLDWQQILNDTNLKKIIEQKLIKNERIMTTIGRPIQLKIVENNNEMSSIPTYEAQIKLLVNGRLNDGEFVLKLKKDQDTKKWDISHCEFKMLWDASSSKN